MKLFFQAGLLFVVITVMSGIIYPSVVTLIGQILWAHKTNGSLLKNGDTIIGSELIGQRFTSPKYFWGRPSASRFSAMPAFASNLGPTSAELKKTIAKRRRELSESLDVMPEKIPGDLITSSASGLDPHISVAAAKIQVKRIAHVRGLNREQIANVERLIDENTRKPMFGILGETTVNVLRLNLALDNVNLRSR